MMTNDSWLYNITISIKKYSNYHDYDHPSLYLPDDTLMVKHAIINADKTPRWCAKFGMVGHDESQFHTWSTSWPAMLYG